jgi:hypothetical protein
VGFAVGFATTLECPDGCPQLDSAMWAPFAVFMAGNIAILVFTAAIRVRQSANPPRPQPVMTGISSSVDQAVFVAGPPTAQFRPMTLEIRKDILPISSNVPWLQRWTIRPEGLEMRVFFSRVWVARDRITGLYRMPGEIRVIWDGGDGAATVSDWRIKEIAGAMEQAGYRFDPD